MNYKEFFASKTFRRVLFVLGGLVIASLIFFSGIMVGYHKAAFSYRFGDNYHHVFGEREPGMFPGGFIRDEFTAAHGAVGKIVSINLPNIIIEGNDGVEKSVTIANDTLVKRFRDTGTSTDLKVGDNVVVLGAPNATTTQIEAKLIRLLPPLPLP